MTAERTTSDFREETGVRSGDRLLPARTLAGRAARAAAGFASFGVGKGDSVALLMRNDIAFLEASIGLSRLGAYAVPVNWHFKRDEVAYLLEDSGAKVIVAHSDLLPPVAEAVPPGVARLVVETPPEVASSYGVDAEACRCGPDAIEWEAWLSAQDELTAPPVPSPDSMTYTSGTTGKPKGVRRGVPDAEQAKGMDFLRRKLFGLAPGSRSLVTGPMYHSAPNNFGMQAARYSELTVLMPRFDAETMLMLVERHRITSMFMVPTMFVRLLRLPEPTRRRYDLSSLNFVVHSAAPCPPDVKRAMIEWWGPILYEFYGASESGPISFADSEEWLSHPGTVGRILPGASVRVVGPDDRELLTGEPGELFVRQKFTPDFVYHKLPERRREVERDGLFTCGDVGYVDADDFLYLCDRKRDMVISGGVNIYPAEIEAVLITCPGVKDCAVFGIPHPDYGETLMAVIEPAAAAAPTAAEITAYLSERLAGYKVPRRIEFAQDLPREDSGKIFKRRLRDPYWAETGRAI